MKNNLSFHAPENKQETGLMVSNHPLFWDGDPDSIVFDEAEIRDYLMDLNQPIWIIKTQNGIGFSQQGNFKSEPKGPFEIAARTNPISIKQFGDSSFCEDYNIKAAYYAGGMANAISSEEMVIALGKSGFIGSFGAAGLSPARLESAIQKIQSALSSGPYIFNFIHNPFEPSLEQRTIDLYLKYGIHVIEAAAFINLSPSIVTYRAIGLSLSSTGEINIKNRIIAKVSRKEVASKFLQPAPEKILQKLITNGHITEQQAVLARQVPIADDITVEADSGGHTDNRPLVSLLPSMIALRDQLQNQYKFRSPVRIGAGGGISTPESALAAYMMGAAYVVTGSINQACTESGACEHTRKLLAQADMADVIMTPSADMFEMGVRVQVLKKGTLFPMRAQKLYDLYSNYNSIEEIPIEDRKKIEKNILQLPLEVVWQKTVEFFNQRDPQQIIKAENNPKRKMALIFRWYLGLSSRWSRDAVKGREMDYQIWCGPSIGAFNEWTKNTYLEEYQNRHVTDVAQQILNGCAYRYRVQALKLQGLKLPSHLEAYIPEPLN